MRCVKSSAHCFRVIVQLTLVSLSFRRSDERCESPDCRSVEISGSSRHLSWHADEHASRPEDDDWLWSSNPAIRRRKAGGVAASRESSLQFVSAPFRHAPVLARFRIPRAVDALGTASHLVAELPERLRGNRILARDLFHARWDGSHIRRHESFCRHDALRGAKTGARSNVWRPRSFRPDG